ncbi:MAG: efflux RND transporter periplasmic adaptor subunit [Planctomycetes bacterium]|nr:efflux RND transporter periplasmic adaptor subunit [Planctomycetota bacterium]
MSVLRSVLGTCVILLAAMTVAVTGCNEKNPKAVATPPAVVMVSKPIERKVTDYQVFTARTQAVQSVDIKARVTGFLTKLCFKDGDEVKENQVLFEIDDRPYKAALDMAKANLEFTKAALIKSQAEYEIGIAVQKQDKGAISEQDLVKRLGSRDESKASVDKAKAALENAQLNFDWCKVTSPLSGRINRHFVDVGNLVSQDVTLLTNIVSLKPTWAYFDVDQNTALRFGVEVKEGKVKSPRKVALPVTMTVTSNPERFEGIIDFISNQLDANTGSIRVRAAFPNENDQLLAGLFGRVTVPMSSPHPALLVLDRAIGTDQGKKYILVVNDKNEVEYRPVEVRQLHGAGLREVLSVLKMNEPDASGKDVTKEVEVLKPTDRIIVEGMQRARPGATVDPRPVDMLTLLNDSQSGAGAAKKSATTSK